MTSLKQVRLPVSKSLYIRKLICDFLYGDRVDDIPVEVPTDVQVVHDALEVIAGASKRKLSATEMNVSVSSGAESENGSANKLKLVMDKGQMQEFEVNMNQKPVVIDVHDCGAAYRFLMAVLAVTPGQWLLTGTERLLQRPIEELVQCLRSIGADIHWIPNDDDVVPRGDVASPISDNHEVNPCRNAKFCVSTNNGEMVSRGDAWSCVSTESMPSGWLIHGKPLHASDLTIDCHRSGQFASALWLISNKIGLKNLHILPENPSSLSYIEMTKAVMNGTEKLIDGNLADWSAAVYWYAHMLLEGQTESSNRLHSSSNAVYCDVPASYKLLHLDLSSIQSDAVIAKWFADWGIESCQEEDGVVISYNERFDKPQDVVELDMSQNLDLVPVMACMACLWPKKMIFNGVANLKYKESDRLQIIQEQLSAFADIKLNTYNGVEDNQLVVNPCRDARPCVSTKCLNDSNCPDADFVFDAHNDHRFVMGFSLFALKGTVYIKGFDSVKKSYPDFHAEGVVGGTDMVG